MITFQDIGINMFTIDQNLQTIMDDVDTGAAFDRSIIIKLDDMMGEWVNVEAQEDTLFGSFSPAKGKFTGLADSTPYSLGDLDSVTLTDKLGAPILLTDAEKTLLVDEPKGALSGLRKQMNSQFGSLVDNIRLYSSHQRVKNAMGQETGCGELSNHFGTITGLGQQISNTVFEVKNAIDQVKLLKTQIQSEIDAFDTNVINLLTGRINGTILSQIIEGSGLHDQLDNILIASGIANDSIEAEEIRTKAGEFLNDNLINFFNKKTEVNEGMKDITKEKGGILKQIGTEKAVLDKALTILRKLSDASSITGLFKSNECIQTLMGFVGTDSFLNKLGAS